MGYFSGRRAALFLGCVLVAACSVAPVRPYIEDFSRAVSSATASTERRFDQMRLDEELDALRRATLAQSGALYTLEGCTPLEPLAEDFDNAPGDFEDGCQISAQSFNPETQEISPATVSLPEGDPRVEARNARNLVRALNDYASALDDLVQANSRSETAAAATNALKAVGNFVASGGSDRTPKLFSREGQTLVSNLTDEALEAYRFRLLRDVTTQANAPVEQATRAVAAWLSRTSDNARVEAAYDALERAVDAAQPGSAADLKAIEDAFENAKSIEESTSWRVYWEIGAAHAAIVKSFAAPADFDRLKDANDRILTLAEVAKAFAESR